MKVIIAGSRTIDSYPILLAAIDECPWRHEITSVLSGAARGVDRLGERWARDNNVALDLFPADWTTHGLDAGFIRNAEMAEKSDALIIVWDGESGGSRDMLHRMLKLEKPVFELVVRLSLHNQPEPENPLNI